MNPVKLPLIFRPFYCADLVRLGKDNDGGYLVNPVDVTKTNKLMSFGIGDDCSFEQDFTRLQECIVEAYDGTLTVEQQHSMQSGFFQAPHKLTVRNIGTREDQVTVTDLDFDRAFLKCDIEDSEYRILDDIIRMSDRLTGMVIEFHQIQEPGRFNLLTNFIGKVQLNLIHVHINNWAYLINGSTYLPDVVELSFTSSDNISWQPVRLPHALDMPNCADRPEFEIRF